MMMNGSRPISTASQLPQKSKRPKSRARSPGHAAVVPATPLHQEKQHTTVGARSAQTILDQKPPPRHHRSPRPSPTKSHPATPGPPRPPSSRSPTHTTTPSRFPSKRNDSSTTSPQPLHQPNPPTHTTLLPLEMNPTLGPARNPMPTHKIPLILHDPRLVRLSPHDAADDQGAAYQEHHTDHKVQQPIALAPREERSVLSFAVNVADLS